MRSSGCRDDSLRAAPEGLIDPWLKTVSLFSEEQAVVQLHYCATHPQSFYNDGRTSYDTCGIARERLQKKSHIFQIYFTGCGGDIAMGKYNNGSRQSRDELTDRLFDAMQRSVTEVNRESIKQMY